LTGTTKEEQVFQAAQRGSLSAFYKLVDAFDGPMLNLALRITGSEEEARAIYCETMFELHASLGSARCECSLLGCAYRILAGRCLAYLRAEQGVVGRADDSVSSTLKSLSPRERVVFELRHYQGLDLSTVGQALGTTETVARDILVRAGHKLRTALAADADSNETKGSHAQDSPYR
jgi:RNA polymerase sigma-70 factor (ECF subfamily)